MIEVGATEIDYLSKEPVQGELLAEKLAAGPVPANEALRYAIDIGSALQRAHTRGLVHGSVAPENIAITTAGARLLQPREAPAASLAPYRSPEQVRGEAVDWRSDIFSYGALLYELASGNRAFGGEGSALDGAILNQSPAPLRAKTPVEAAFEGVVAGCLQKDPAQRRQRMQNAVIELKLSGRPGTRPSAHKPTAIRSMQGAPPRPGAENLSGKTAKAARPEYWVPAGMAQGGTRRRLTIIGLATLALAASGVAAALYLERPTQPVLKFSVTPPEHTSYPGTPAVSPDGLSLTFSAVGPEGHRMLWLRAFDEMHAKVIPGTEGGFAPFWSPDSQHIGFFANKSLKQVHLLSNLNEIKPEIIADADVEPGGGTWNKDGTIVFAPSMSDALYKVPATGGKAVKLMTLDPAKGERAQLWPQFLPDGKHFLFFLLTAMTDTTGVYTGSLDSAEFHRLFQAETNAVYSPLAGESSGKGYLLYMKGRDLMGQGFNASKLETDGAVITLANDIGAVQTLSLAPISVSRNAVLVYQSVAKATRQLVWMDRSGRTVGTIPEAAEWGPPRISPDGTRFVVGKLGKDQENAELWILDAAGNETLFQSQPHVSEGSPIWSPDGTRIAFWDNENRIYDIYAKPVNGGKAAELIYKDPLPKYPTDWSHDGRFIIFGELSPGTRSDVMALTLSDRHAAPVIDTVFAEGYATLSPDGRWLAYQSDESGRNEVYVQRFEGATAGTKRRWKVSIEGGGLPKWRADSSELFYMTVQGSVFAVAVHPTAEEFQFDKPQELFSTRPIPRTWNLYDVSPDGERFLMNLPLEWTNSSLITVMTNWTEKLKS